jgi:uncharacterized membrane protein
MTTFLHWLSSGDARLNEERPLTGWEFSDGTFAVIITIMALELKLPEQ